jgi:hypothetical protein
MYARLDLSPGRAEPETPRKSLGERLGKLISRPFSDRPERPDPPRTGPPMTLFL